MSDPIAKASDDNTPTSSAGEVVTTSAPTTETAPPAPAPGQAEPVAKPSESTPDSIEEIIRQALEPEKPEAKPEPKEELPPEPQPKVEPKPEPEKKQEAETAPFHEHPRWKEVLRERDEAKQRLQSQSGLVAAAEAFRTYTNEHGLTESDVRSALELAALARRDPAAFAERARPLVEAAEILQGKRLPADLAEEVEAGKLSESRAVELAKLRVSSQQLTHNTKLFEQRQEETRQRDIAGAINAWVESKKKEPDFAAKEKMWVAYFMRKCSEKVPTNGTQTAALAEEAYQETNETIASLMPKPAARHASPTSGRASARNEEPKADTWDDLAAIARSALASRH